MKNELSNKDFLLRAIFEASAGADKGGLNEFKKAIAGASAGDLMNYIAFMQDIALMLKKIEEKAGAEALMAIINNLSLKANYTDISAAISAEAKKYKESKKAAKPAAAKADIKIEKADLLIADIFS